MSIKSIRTKGLISRILLEIPTSSPTTNWPNISKRQVLLLSVLSQKKGLSLPPTQEQHPTLLLKKIFKKFTWSLTTFVLVELELLLIMTMLLIKFLENWNWWSSIQEEELNLKHLFRGWVVIFSDMEDILVVIIFLEVSTQKALIWFKFLPMVMFNMDHFCQWEVEVSMLMLSCNMGTKMTWLYKKEWTYVWKQSLLVFYTIWEVVVMLILWWSEILDINYSEIIKWWERKKQLFKIHLKFNPTI